MKRICKNLFLLLIPILFAGVVISPFKMSESFSFAETGITEENVIELNKTNIKEKLKNEGKFILTEDITIDDDYWTPIPNFKGELDGNGYRMDITIDGSSGGKLGLFSTTEKAVIKNLKIKEITVTGVNSGLVFGSIVGYAQSTDIINCEVEKISFESDADVKITNTSSIGIFAGQTSGGSIVNCDSYASLDIATNLSNACFVRIGGIVGYAVNTEVKNIALFGDLNFDHDESENEWVVYNIGALIGYYENVTLFNCVVGGNVINKKDSEYKGALFGAINGMEKNKIGNIAFVEDLIVSNETIGFEIDYLCKVPQNALVDENFFFSDEYLYNELEIPSIFKWNNQVSWEDGDWMFITVNNSKSQFRLQIFQKFEIKLGKNIVNSGNVVLVDRDAATSHEGEKNFGEPVEFDIGFDDPLNFNFYEISNILLNGKKLDSFSRTDNGSDVCLIEKEKDEEKYYTLKIIASDSTKGTYTVECESKKYWGSVIVRDGDSIRGSVKFGDRGSEREFNKGTTATVSATPNSKYLFQKWSLYYKTGMSEALNADNSLKNNCMKIGYEYWQLQGIIQQKDLTGTSYSNAGQSFKIKFGNEDEEHMLYNESAQTSTPLFVKKDFILVADFNYDPYKIGFNCSENSSGIKSLKINGVDVTEEDSFFDIGKNDSITIELELTEGFVLNEKSFLESLQDSNGQPEVNNNNYNQNENKYIFTFNSSNLSQSKLDSEKKMTLKLEVTNNKDKDDKKMMWIIIGCSIGGVIIIGLIVFLCIWFGVGKGGKGGNKEKKIKPDLDYKKYFG